MNLGPLSKRSGARRDAVVIDVALVATRFIGSGYLGKCHAPRFGVARHRRVCGRTD